MPKPSKISDQSKIKEFPGLANRFALFRSTYVSPTQGEAAKMLNTTQAYLSLIESGQRLPGPKLVAELSTRYALNQDWLYKNTGPKRLKADDKGSSLMKDVSQITADMKKLLSIYNVMAKQQAMLFNKIEALEKVVEEQQKIIDNLTHR